MTNVTNLAEANRLLEVARRQLREAHQAGLIDAATRDARLAALDPTPPGREVAVTLRVQGELDVLEANRAAATGAVERALAEVARQANLTVVPDSVRLSIN